MEITLHLNNILDLLTSVYSKKSAERVVNYEDIEISDFPRTVLDTVESRYTLDDLIKENSKKYFIIGDSNSKFWCTFVDREGKNIQLERGKGLLCWHDCHTFDTVPLGCPLKKLGDSTFLTTGVFCSFPCIKKFLKRRLNRSKYKDSQNLLTLMYVRANKKIEEIPLAPSRKQLKKFGGILTISEFRSSFGRLEYTSYKNNISIPIQEMIQERITTPRSS